MVKFNKVTTTLMIVPFLILLFFSSNIYGYFRFKHYCSSEGGLRVYEKLERNAGWWAKNKYYAQIAASLDGVGFVRYKEKNGALIDIRYIGGDLQSDDSFEAVPANELNGLAYNFQYINENILNELRLGRSGYEISDYKTNKILVRFHMFGYTKFDRDYVPLDMRISSSCFDENGSSLDDLPRSLKDLNTVFKP